MSESDLLAEAERIAAAGPISPAGRWAFRGIEAAVAGLPPTARPTAIWAALGKLAEDDRAVATHALAALLRAEQDVAIEAAWLSRNVACVVATPARAAVRGADAFTVRRAG